MKTYKINITTPHTILSLGPESAGNFSVYVNGTVYSSEDYGDLLDDARFAQFQKAVLDFLTKEKIRPDVILTDLHPLYKTTAWGEELARKFKAIHKHIQHHYAHIFSAIGEEYIHNQKPPSHFYGITLDGTGYGTDERIWGGEIFEITKNTAKKYTIKRIGQLENQTMIGGDLTIREPARMLISLLAKVKSDKNFVYSYVKKYYDQNHFELLWNQLQQNFNCQETSSTGRILDATSVLLGFAQNKRGYKHEPTILLEQNTDLPYKNLRPYITQSDGGSFLLSTTALFDYLTKNIHKDKKRLSATAQLYIAHGLHEIIKKHDVSKHVYLSGGISTNKIISNYFAFTKMLQNEKSTVARGDSGLSFGQIMYHLLTEE